MKLAWQSVALLPVFLPVAFSQDTCSNGIEGIDLNGVVCCPLLCSECGGPTCGANGLGDSCCGGSIKDSGILCSESGAAPCIIDVVDEPPTTSECSNGLEGIDGNGVVCCPIGCGQCGGNGCAAAGQANGLDADSCCGSNIKDTGVMCSVSGAAPCIIDEDIAPAPAPSPTVTPVAGPTATPVAGLTATPVAGPTATPVAGPTATPVAGPTATPVAGPTATPVAGPTATPVAGPTATPVAGPTASPVATPMEVDSYLITPPTPVMTIPTTCESDVVPSFRYAASSGKVGKGRLYAESEGCFTMTDIYNWRGVENDGSSKGPIYQLDDAGDKILIPTGVSNKWLLEAELYVTDGAIFYCIGSSEGGDCDELRIKSNGPEDFYEVRGHGGSLYFESTIVTSWDTEAKAPQEEYEGGRSFLNCVSEKAHEGDECEGQAKNEMGECRMDMFNSEIGYLGWFDSESYGITWKVRGFCKDLSNHDVFTKTNVYGDIMGCDIHHNYYGHYSYGHEGGVWTNNKMHDNHQYGFDPHDDSDYLTIAYNEVYNNVNHGIIASKRCNNVKIYNNDVSNGGAQAAGIFLHRSTDNAEVYNNKITNMMDAGIAMLESMNADIHDNEIDGVRFGIRMSLGSAGNKVYDNTFNACSDYGLYTYQGTDEPTVGVSDGRPFLNTFDGNVVSNTEGGVKFKRSDNIIVMNNEFTGTTELEFFDAQNTQWSSNTLPASGVCVDNISSDDGNVVTPSTFVNSEGLPDDC